MDASPSTDVTVVTRRHLLSTTATTVAATLLAQAVPIEWPARLLGEAAAAGPDLVRDTLNGFVAFIVPGSDRYSRAQGTPVRGPGGIGAGATGPIIAMLDFLESDAGGHPLPQAAVVAALLNSAAQRVNPNADRGAFASPFARLSFDEKIAAFKEIETDPALASTRGLLAGLPGVVGLIAYSEAPALDRRTGSLRHTPVGWRMSGYGGAADGRDELRGFYGGRKTASDA